MQTGIILIYLSLAFACTLSGYVFAARSQGWPVGEIFANGKIPTFLSIACIFSGLGYLLAAIIQSHQSWWLLLGGVTSYFVGAPIVMGMFRKHSGLLSLVAAPATGIAAFVV